MPGPRRIQMGSRPILYLRKSERETALHKSRAAYIELATETANLAENLPDGVTTGVAIGLTREEEHLADLLFRICLARTIGL